jgi:hypothetical protein
MHALAPTASVVAMLATIGCFIWGSVCALRMSFQIAEKRPDAGWWNRFGGANFFKTHKTLYPASRLRARYLFAMVGGCLSMLAFGASLAFQN